MFRVYHEMRNQEHRGWFLTLTYSEKYVKRTKDGRLSLRFRDVQLFLKQLRKRKFYVKYICVGEYGGQTLRPHYHMLLWTDCTPEELERIWFRGQIHFGTITIQSAMYTLKYIIQPKQKQEDDLEKTRAQFSKGLGLSYLDIKAYEYHTRDYEDPELFSVIDGNKVALPRYYRNKIFTKHQLKRVQVKTKWESIKKYRQYMRELLAKGVKDTKSYILALRTIENERLISKTKFNQTI